MSGSLLAVLLRAYPGIRCEELPSGRVAFSARIARRGRDQAARLEVISRHVTNGSLACFDDAVWVRSTVTLESLTPDTLEWILETLEGQAERLARVWNSAGYFLV
jgi:hypothetical protein